MDIVAEKTHRERAYDRNVRYIAYSLLKDVKFSDEPVVPKIISESKDEFGPHFNVEELPGIDLADFLFLPEEEVGTKDKFSAMLHVAKQLEAIDKAGFVIFDRNSGNIRVLDWKDGKISTRQVDIEDYYDKLADATYSSGDQKGYEEMVDLMNSKGVNLWAYQINKLIASEVGIATRAGKPEIKDVLEKHEWPDGEKKGCNLSEHIKTLEQIMESL